MSVIKELKESLNQRKNNNLYKKVIENLEKIAEAFYNISTKDELIDYVSPMMVANAIQATQEKHQNPLKDLGSGQSNAEDNALYIEKATQIFKEDSKISIEPIKKHLKEYVKEGIWALKENHELMKPYIEAKETSFDFKQTPENRMLKQYENINVGNYQELVFTPLQYQNCFVETFTNSNEDLKKLKEKYQDTKQELKEMQNYQDKENIAQTPQEQIKEIYELHKEKLEITREKLDKAKDEKELIQIVGKDQVDMSYYDIENMPARYPEGYNLENAKDAINIQLTHSINTLEKYNEKLEPFLKNTHYNRILNEENLEIKSLKQDLEKPYSLTQNEEILNKMQKIDTTLQVNKELKQDIQDLKTKWGRMKQEDKEKIIKKIQNNAKNLIPINKTELKRIGIDADKIKTANNIEKSLEKNYKNKAKASDELPF